LGGTIRQKIGNSHYNRVHPTYFGPLHHQDLDPVENRGESLKADKRQHPRYSVRDEGIEIFSRQSEIIGKLENISKSGMAFRYTAVGEKKVKSETIDILATGPARFYLSGLVCRMIYDISALDEAQTLTGAETRLCGHEFVRIENEQKLSFFLRDYLNRPAAAPFHL